MAADDSSVEYDAFISYSRAADEALAGALRDGLQTLGKRWNQRRALSVFLDAASLEASASIGDAIRGDLDQTRYLVLLACPESAGSRWVDAEIEHWLAGRPSASVQIALTGGEIRWDNEVGDFDFEASTALSPAFRGAFPEEPLYVDLRWAAETPDPASLDIRANARFASDVAALAAPMHGVSKDELVGRDIEQYRRGRRLRRLAVTGLAILALVASTLAVLAVLAQRAAATNEQQAQERAVVARMNAAVASLERDVAVDREKQAEKQTRIATARSLGSEAQRVAAVHPQLSFLLAAEAERLTPGAPDSARAVAAATASWWETPLRQVGDPIVGHDIRILSAAIDPSGSYVATGDDSGNIRITNLATRELLLAANAGPGVEALAWDSDGRRLISGSREGDMVRWEFGADEADLSETARGTATYIRDDGEEVPAYITDAAVLLDDQTVISVGHDGAVRAWSLDADGPEWMAVDVVDLGDMSLEAVDSHPLDPSRLVVGGRWGDQPYLAELEWDSGRLWWSRELPTGAVTASIYDVVFDPAGDQIVVGDDSGVVTVLGADDLGVRQRFTALSPIRRLAVHDDITVAASLDGSLSTWASHDGRWLGTISSHTAELRDVSVVGDTIVTTGWDLTTRVWQVGQVDRLAPTPDRRLVAVDSVDGDIVVAGTSGAAFLGSGRIGPPLEVDGTVEDFVADVAFAPDGGSLYWATKFSDEGERVVRWRDDEGAVVLADGLECVSALAVSSSGVLAARSGGDLLVWDDPDGAPGEIRLIDVPDGPAGCDRVDGQLAAFVDDRVLVLAIVRDNVYEIDLGADEPVAEELWVGPTDIADVAVSADGTMLALAGNLLDLYTAPIADLRGGADPMVLSGHTDRPSAVVFSRDGRTLVSGGGDQSIRYWDLRTGTEVASFRFSGGVQDLAVDLDDRALAITSLEPLERFPATPTDPFEQLLPSKPTACELALRLGVLPEPEPWLGDDSTWACSTVPTN